MKKCEPIGAGDLRDLISIETYTDSKDQIGVPVSAWSNFTTVMAKVDWVRGDEEDNVTKETSETQVNFWIRTIADINIKMRITHEENTFDIRGILPKGQKNMYSKVLTVLIE